MTSIVNHEKPRLWLRLPLLKAKQREVLLACAGRCSRVGIDSVLRNKGITEGNTETPKCWLRVYHVASATAAKSVVCMSDAEPRGRLASKNSDDIRRAAITSFA
ncbi:hypothetical protein OAO87_03680 [bacterium]|nr:hypothetical protein [bacterium]